MKKDYFVSVIIPTFNREEVLCNTVRQLLIQTYPDYEIIIVDQTKTHTPETAAFLETHASKIRLYTLDKANAPAAKNYGSANAKGDILLFLDDDITMQNDLISAHMKNYSDPTIGVVAGRVMAEGLSRDEAVSPVGKILPNGEIIVNFHSNIRQDIDVGPGGNWSMYRELFIKAGGFDERFAGNAMKEEPDLAVRIKKLGKRIVFDPTAEVFHLAYKRGGTRSLNRLDWYEHFFHNEFLFFLKHCKRRYLLSFFIMKARAIIACMFFYGKAAPQALAVPFKGLSRAYREYSETKDYSAIDG